MNLFEKSISEIIGQTNLKKLQQVRIGIAGAGGLGSNCAFNLVRSGFNQLLIVDFDTIEPSNLNRQFYFYHQLGQPKVKALKENLMQIQPDLQIQAIEKRLEKNNIKEIFKSCDIVVEAFDQAEYKALLIQELLEEKELIVSASGIAGWGQSDELITHLIRKNLIIIGDLKTEVTDDMPPISPKVNIAAAKQADIILEYVLGRCNVE
ncbi:sulfur carrier protein ThiS adenylyltransferase [Natranaerovirga hydrolytica]|uniref:Sulfur carrier protein ThiS adenylyltransferase n=1 Tax=Natranaerovirga hydrolytica TaxID=680378 RepID=A0A4R1MZX4_9FIRM|nr:sulfur carrier protein ThiS adenylyltransferase ThiF [Natranaerovirga hydrolytica]TCK98755.1 sulfur carrier protein ThiS adenylyltransferase [Natranaerovirga hydrolytica]